MLPLVGLKESKALLSQNMAHMAERASAAYPAQNNPSARSGLGKLMTGELKSLVKSPVDCGSSQNSGPSWGMDTDDMPAPHPSVPLCWQWS